MQASSFLRFQFCYINEAGKLTTPAMQPSGLIHLMQESVMRNHQSSIWLTPIIASSSEREWCWNITPPPPLDLSGRVGKSWFVNFLITCMQNWKNIIVETSHWKDCSSNALIVINYTRNIIIRNSWKVWTIIVVCSPICHCLCVVLVLFI